MNKDHHWVASYRNGYWAIDEKISGESGTVGNPVVLIGCGETVAKKIADELNRAFFLGKRAESIIFTSNNDMTNNTGVNTFE